MRNLAGLGIAILFIGTLSAQYRGNPTPVVKGGFPNVVFPAGTRSTVPGIQRNFGNVVYPGGGGPRLSVPFSPTFSRPNHHRNGAILPYAYPVYVGGYYDSSYMGTGDPAAQQQLQQQQQQPNVTVIYPPQPAPVIINQFGSPSDAQAQPSAPSAPDAPPSLYVAPPQDDTTAAAPEPTHYLLAFKDHTIYSAIAYWVEGETLHYFTTGNTHNQVSLALVDRDLTERLNKESGLDVRFPVK